MERSFTRLIEPYAAWLQALSDAVWVWIAARVAYIAYIGPLDSMPERYQILVFVLPVLIPAWFTWWGVYSVNRGISIWLLQRRLWMALLSLCTVAAVVALVTKTGAQFSRVWIGLFLLTSGLSMSLTRWGAFSALAWWRGKGHNKRFVLLVGNAEKVGAVAEHLNGSASAGFFVIDKVIIERDFGRDTREWRKASEEIKSILTSNTIDQVWVVTESHGSELLGDVLEVCLSFAVRVVWVPDMFGSMLLRQELRVVSGMPTVCVRTEPLSVGAQLAKSMEDKLLALIICIAISPLLLVIALAIKLESRGPVIFRQLRHGGHGKEIEVYKFRSMREHKAEDGPIVLATQGDMRVTRVGSFIRRTSLDELPQFINVLQGRMSIVGPRPHPVSLEDYYSSCVDRYRQRYQVKPGITGWAQINGYRGNTDTPEKIRKRVEYDLYYLENWSILFDLKIVLLTALKGWVHPNAY